MKEIELNSWDEFSSTISKIKNDFESHEIAGIQLKNTILYRGQSDSQWPPDTTLERYSSSEWSIEDYTRLTLRCAPQVESFTAQSWNLRPDHEILEEIRRKSEDFSVPLPAYDFWIYLRHHGFPSPLLDWTASPYIAAFFAFEEHIRADNASIFVYVPTPRGVKTGWGGQPQISVHGPYVRSHKRHFLQQSWYTVCTKFEDNSHAFVCHEHVFEREDKRQDILYKITIPRSERFKALSYLDEVNINHFSLFQSEGSLMKTMAFNEIDMKNL